ncbi:Prefoldin beta-like protein [Mycena sanguinolenta]|uniref:Prefoldin beta-like protein n=1 Tax=Mycena sanguinolenta TaxID=230812 RepID=A0A8H6YAJ4_9AGAR|nr:Prefoldin beta-like protein [Mycena sanguinolenta]
MSSAATKAKGKTQPLTDQEISQNYSRMQNELQGLAGKIGELEQEADEHSLVLTTLNEALAEEPDRKCFRLIGGVPSRTHRQRRSSDASVQQGQRAGLCSMISRRLIFLQIKKVVANLTEQYKTREEEFDAFKREYNIRPAART